MVGARAPLARLATALPPSLPAEGAARKAVARRPFCMAEPAGPRGGGGDEAADSLPCAARAPLPAAPARPPRPDPDVLLTPDRQGILRRRRPEKAPRRQVRFQVDSGEDGGGLGAPALHSSAALGAEVQAAREQAFDGRQAARHRLRRSFLARCAVDGRAAEGTNIPREQQLYQGLVSLQVPAEEVLSSAVQEKLALAGPWQLEARKESACRGPDLLAFYDPEELFTETAFLDVEGLPPLELKPRTRDAAATFLMYRKLRQWDS